MSAAPPEALRGLRPLGLRVTVDAPAESNHASFVVAGLRQLADHAIIARLRIRVLGPTHRGEVRVDDDGSLAPSSSAVARKTLFIDASDASGRHRLAIDLRDAADLFAADALDLGGVDAIWKRSYDQRVVDRLHRRSPATTVLPAGLSFRVGLDRASDGRAVIAALGATGVRSAVRFDRTTPARLRAVVAGVRTARRSLPGQWDLDALRATPPVARATRGTSATVLFQTRTFGDRDDQDTVDVVDERASIIRALRAELGPRFRGGFVPDPLALRRYPDCISDVRSDRASYGAAMAGAAIVVSSGGLAGSIPWKLPEAMALGCCIVAETTSLTVPGPFSETFAPYGSVDDCVEQVVRLLGDEPTRAQLADRARRYYLEWVDPPIAAHRMLTELLHLTR